MLSRLNFKRCLRNFSCADTRIAQREVILSKKALRHAKPDKFKNSNAFTLAELLVSILIISVILTLLAPVITKRAKESFTVNSSAQYESRLFLYDISDSDCTDPADGTKSLNCKFTAPNDVEEISVVMVSGGGGGAGATNPTVNTNQRAYAASTTLGSSQTKEITITSGMKNVVISYLAGSGAGGGGASWSGSASSYVYTGPTPQSQLDCDKYNAKFIPAAYNGGSNVCVTKYNVGDNKGPTIANSTTKVTAGSGTRCDAEDDECCWKGTTTRACTASGSWSGHSSNYSGCNRTVCNWNAANASCQSWAPSGTSVGDWRLPTETEIQNWMTVINTESNGFGKISRYLGSDGLQLCDNSDSTYGSVKCTSNSNPNQCRSSSSCAPFMVWTSTKYSSIYLSRGRSQRASSGGDTAYSVRCVLGPVNGDAVTLSGGGGGAGAYVKNYQIPNSVISSNIGGKIVLYSAAGGAGGSSASSSGGNASNGSNGNTSYIEVYSSDNVLKWGIRASGGYAGEGASSSSYGEGGAERSIASCQLYENGSWRSVNCTGIGAKGLDGTKAESASSTNTATGGSGGGSMYNSSTVIGGGSGGSISSANGYNGSVYGAGGGGATIVFDSSNNVTKGIGGNGANGVAEITYDLVRQAAGGGGGGGGAFIRVEKIKVTSGKEYTIKVASGGAAGSVATKGSDGGVTSATFDSVTYTLSGGKGGQIGTSSTDTSNVIQGIGGLGGIVSSNVSDTTNIEYKNGLKGDDGNTYTTTTGFIVSNGGNGGTSGLDTKGGCGGLFIDSSICTNTNVNGTSVNFVSPNQIFDTAQYGAAGAGGSGGGWSEDTFNYPNSGGGSQGQSGYVYINWVKYKN